MSSSRRNGLVNLIGFGFATGLGLGIAGTVSWFNSKYGPVIAELESLEATADMVTQNASLHAKDFVSNMGYNSEEERSQKLRNVSLTPAQSLVRDGRRYEQLNSDAWLNDVVYPADQILNPRLPSTGSPVPATFPAGYVAAGALTLAGLYGVAQSARRLRSS